MKTISRYIMTLALLLTAATGAWAETEVLLTTINASSDFTSGSKTFDNVATVTFEEKVSCSDNAGWYTNGSPISVTVAPVDGVTITSVKFFIGDNSPEDTQAPFTATLYIESGMAMQTQVNDTYYDGGLKKIEVYGAASSSSGPEVTLNADNTEATMEMPASDVTAEYELVRDMSVQMTAQVGDGTQEQPRYRVKKDGNNKFIPADMEMAAVPALFTVNDAIEQKTLTQTQDYTVQIYAIDAEGQPTGEAMTFATFTFEPGIYAVKAVAADGSDYDGETALSNTFQLFQGYEVTVAAGEYATMYAAENLSTEEAEDAQFYTITSVGEESVTLSSAFTTAPKETPLLVYNNSTEEKTFLLLPTEETAADVTAADEFKGTLEEQQMSASSDDTEYYVLNGKSFVWVKNAGTIAANRCWLQLAKGTATARTLPLVFDDATGITAADKAEQTAGNWYDLNGRKLTRKPAAKGVYIQNGRKVVVK